MTSESLLDKQKLHRRGIALRTMTVLLLLLLAQVIVTYSTFQLIDILPSSWTGILDDRDVQRTIHKGTVYLIEKQLAEESSRPVQEVLQELQPHFDFPLSYIPEGIVLSDEITSQLKKHDIAYDDDDDEILAPLATGGYLKLGPLVLPDILDANASAALVLTVLWFCVSVLISFIIIYMAYAALWREAQTISHIAHNLGEGDLSTRVPRIRNEPFKTIGHVINDMAVRIEMLVNHSKIMLHAMAHEFRTPLARLRFGITMLEDAGANEKTKLYKGINRDLHELETLIKVSLNYLRMNHKSMPAKLQTVRLRKWIPELVNGLRPLQPKGFEVKLNIPDIEGYFDPELAAIALRNLLLNAFKYAHSQAILHVLKDGDALIFELDDDGPGIPDESREKVFSPFFRLDTKHTGEENGYGVGLSFVRAIAELHQGSAFVLTSPLGGARFVMRFGV